jgi:hypothetical protein
MPYCPNSNKAFKYSAYQTKLPRHAELVSASIHQLRPRVSAAKWTLKHVQGDSVFYRYTPAT